jgi:hypothetical protein
VEFVVVLLASSSYFKFPNLPSGQYQDFFARHVVQRLTGKGISVVDLSALLRTRFRDDAANLFFPHEGHLTATGHKHVAEILGTELTRIQPGRVH